MAKSKNRRKNGKVKKHTPSKPKKISVESLPKPHCKICKTETRLATQQEMAQMKAMDESFNLPFLWVPECECYLENEEWMEI